MFVDANVPYVQEDPELIVSDGAELVFEAGVDYRFAADARLTVGWNGDDATLQVNGTEESPVVFQGLVPEPGYWHGITIESEVRSTSVISHARIEHGGGEENAVLRCQAAMTLNGVALSENERGAVIEAPLNGDSAGLSITRTRAVPLTASAEALPTLPAGGDMTGNEVDIVEVIPDGSTVATLVGTIPKLNVPYRLVDSIELDDGSDVVIAAGAEFIVASDKLVEIGWNGHAAKLVAAGTADEPLVFRGEQDVAGAWEGILVSSSARGDSRLDHVHIANAGKPARAALQLSRPIDVRNSSFSKSLGYGILKRTSDATAYETTNSFRDNALGSVGTF